MGSPILWPPHITNRKMEVNFYASWKYVQQCQAKDHGTYLQDFEKFSEFRQVRRCQHLAMVVSRWLPSEARSQSYGFWIYNYKASVVVG
jgi:hypothetical protein